MKKLIALLLATVLCLSFAACGDTEEEDEGDSVKKVRKSQAVQDVETMIAELPFHPMDSWDETDIAREKIEAVEEAYNALSAKDQGKVENWQIYEDERARLFESEYEGVALSIQYMDLNSSYLIAGNVTIWDNVGGSDFYTYQGAVLDIGADGYDSAISTFGAEDANTLLWAAGYAFDQDYFGKTFSNFSASKITEIETQCASYAQSIKNIEDAHEFVKSHIEIMVEDYSEEYGTQIEALQNWWAESSLYANHALEPDGNLSTYASDASEYKDNIQRYQTIAGY